MGIRLNGDSTSSTWEGDVSANKLESQYLYTFKSCMSLYGPGFGRFSPWPDFLSEKDELSEIKLF